MVKTIIIGERGNIKIAKTTKRSYFMVKDEQGKEFICFNPSAYNEMPEGSAVAVEITEREGQTPAIDFPKDKESKSPGKEIRRQTDDPTQASIEAQKRADIIANLWIADKLKNNDPLVAKMKAWLLGDTIPIQTPDTIPKTELLDVIPTDLKEGIEQLVAEAPDALKQIRVKYKATGEKLDQMWQRLDTEQRIGFIADINHALLELQL